MAPTAATLLACALTTALPTNLLQADEPPPFATGRWEFVGTVDPDVSGKGEQTHTECVTDQLFDPERIVNQMERGFGEGMCTVTPELDGRQLTLTLQCRSDVGSVDGLGVYDITEDGTAMAGSMDVNMTFSGKSLSLKMNVRGEHKGDC